MSDENSALGDYDIELGTILQLDGVPQHRFITEIKGSVRRWLEGGDPKVEGHFNAWFIQMNAACEAGESPHGLLDDQGRRLLDVGEAVYSYSPFDLKPDVRKRIGIQEDEEAGVFMYIQDLDLRSKHFKAGLDRAIVGKLALLFGPAVDVIAIDAGFVGKVVEKGRGRREVNVADEWKHLGFVHLAGTGYAIRPGKLLY